MCQLCLQSDCLLVEPLDAESISFELPSEVSLDSDGDVTRAVISIATVYDWDVNSLTFSIVDDVSQVDPGATLYDEENYLLQFSEGGEYMIREAMAFWSGISLLSITEVSASETLADLVVGASSLPLTAWAYLPGTAGSTSGGDIWVGASKSYNSLYLADFGTPFVGSYEYYVIMHEIGHSLGLKHPHEAYGSNSNIMVAAYDSVEYTIMSYRSFTGAPATGLTNLSGNFPQSMMILDIAAIQSMYGADYSTLSGDTTYSFNLNTGQMYIDGVSTGATEANVVFRSLWDGGGNDLIDLSNYTTSMQVNLAPGGFILLDTDNNAQRAFLGKVNGVTQYASANIYMSLLYQDDVRSLIENVTTGSGDDYVAGNVADNLIDAGLGSNTVDGDEGTDTVALGVMSEATVSVSMDTNGTMTFSDGTNSTSVLNVEYVTFGATSYSVADLSARYAAAGGTGNILLSTLLVTDPDSDGGAGSGSGSGNSGGSTSPVTVYYDTSYVLLEGTAEVDTMSSNEAAVLWGGAGNDKIWLGGGDDVAIGGEGADLVIVDLRASAPDGIDLVEGLNFADGDRLYIYTRASGTFGNDYNPDNSYWTGSNGELAFIKSFEDLEEVVASEAVTVSAGTYGLVLTFNELNTDYHLELMGFTLDMFSDGNSSGATLDYVAQGYSEVSGTDGKDTLYLKRDEVVYSGGAGQDRFNWDMRSVTSDTHEVITDFDFDEGDWISILTSRNGTFDAIDDFGGGVWNGSGNNQLYIRDLEDLSISVASGALSATNGATGMVLAVNDSTFEQRELEIQGLWLEDLIVF